MSLSHTLVPRQGDEINRVDLYSEPDSECYHIVCTTDDGQAPPHRASRDHCTLSGASALRCGGSPH